MKVWVVGRGFPTVMNKMLGSFELEQAKMLARAGLDVSYLTVTSPSLRRMQHSGFSLRKEDGVDIALFRLPILYRLLTKPMRIQMRQKALKKLTGCLGKKTGNPDIIHVHYPSMVQYRAFKAFQEHGTKIVATEHWSAVQEGTLSRDYLENLKDFTQSSDAMCCVGSSLKTAITEATGTDRVIHIVPNVINVLFGPGKESHEGFRFVCCGRLVPLKQYDKIVNAFLDVFGGSKDVTLTVAGNGSEFENLKTVIRTRNAEEQVRLTGELSRQEMADLMAESDALVVFSEYETFCVPVIEAWACGKPVVAADSTTVIRDNPDPRLGVMTDCHDTESLKEGLRSMYDHYSSYDPEWIRAYAETHFSEKAVSRQLINIYTELISEAR